ncbi:MAG: HIT domain-containing protein [Chloroflexi bacterium]|nr:HIT domain-containing protein [Chloroflexota bacterium]
MEVLWAPWRGTYVRGPKREECFLCQFPQDPPERDAATYVVHRGATGYILLNLFPYSNGHLMVAPYAHVASPEELSPEALLELMQLTNLGLRALRQVSAPHGFNVGMNLGTAAGAGLAEHLHLHVVPRWQGDVNFMPVVGDTRVIPDALDQTWARLRQAIAEVQGPTPEPGEA